MIRITDNHAARLARMSPTRVLPAMGEGMETVARAIAEDAAESIRHGGISGPGHVPSLPGQPPNADTHDLDQSIHVGEVVETPGQIQTAVIADSDHAWIERGGANIEPRPYMEPAAERGRPEVSRELRARFRNQVMV